LKGSKNYAKDTPINGRIKAKPKTKPKTKPAPKKALELSRTALNEWLKIFFPGEDVDSKQSIANITIGFLGCVRKCKCKNVIIEFE
jgi:hypothetical protein